MGSAPLMYWVGMNTPQNASETEVEQFNRFYTETHLDEVLRNNPGFLRATRYELCEPDPRGDFGPRWLAIYEMQDEDAAKLYIARNDSPERANASAYTPGPPLWGQAQLVWRLLWKRLAPLEGELCGAESPYLSFVGMNPGETDAAGLQAFNDFYTNIHVPEVVQRNRFLRGHRYELYRELRHPEPGAPRYLAAYEGDETSLPLGSAGPQSGQPLTKGPSAFLGRNTLWRLKYRRLSSRSK